MPKPFVPFDKWARRAQGEGFRARSVYKLKQLDEQFHLFRPGMRVLDIGAAPGSWLQYASQRVGERGIVLGVDLKPIAPIAPNVKTAVCDITDLTAVERTLSDVGIATVDLLLSDVCSATSGIKDVDQWRSVELNRHVLSVAKLHLKRGGVLVMKVLRGADYDAFLRDVRTQLPMVRHVNPPASRDRSREVYLVCQG